MAEESQPASAAMCRLCLEEQNPEESSGDELIAPCKCTGTQQFVHRSCLDQWRKEREDAFTHCMTCRAQYHLHITYSNGFCCRNAKFCIFKAVDFLIVFLPYQMIICMLGVLAYVYLESFRKSIEIFSNRPLLFYYCVGSLLLFVLLGISVLLVLFKLYNYNPEDDRFQNFRKFCALIIFTMFSVHKSFGILIGIGRLRKIWKSCYGTKLTKEYIVEDLHGNYMPPTQDKHHAAYLKCLGFV